MKIAEALLLGADLQKKLASFCARVGQNAVVQQGDEPHEDPAKLIEDSFSVLKELESLVFRINQANLNIRQSSGCVRNRRWKVHQPSWGWLARDIS